MGRFFGSHGSLRRLLPTCGGSSKQVVPAQPDDDDEEEEAEEEEEAQRQSTARRKKSGDWTPSLRKSGAAPESPRVARMRCPSATPIPIAHRRHRWLGVAFRRAATTGGGCGGGGGGGGSGGGGSDSSSRNSRGSRGAGSTGGSGGVEGPSSPSSALRVVGVMMEVVTGSGERRMLQIDDAATSGNIEVKDLPGGETTIRVRGARHQR